MPTFLRFDPTPGKSESLSSKVTHDLITKAEHIPIFLIPGIFRNPHELLSLARHLNSQYNGERPIYIYSDTSLNEDTAHTPNHMLAALQKIKAYGPLPYLLIGYSDGCQEALITAECLKAEGQHVQVFAIDGTPSAITAAYFNSHTIDSVEDIIKIVNYAGTLSALPNQINLGKDEIKKLLNLELQSCIEHLSLLMLNELNANADRETANTFLGYTHATINLLKSLAANSRAEIPHQPDKLVTFFTNETMRKYGCTVSGNWESQYSNAQAVSHTALVNCSHQEILREPNARHLADIIHHAFLKSAISLDQLFNDQIDYLKKEHYVASRSSNSTSTGSDSEDDKNILSSYAPIPATLENGLHPTLLASNQRFYSPRIDTERDRKNSHTPITPTLK